MNYFWIYSDLLLSFILVNYCFSSDPRLMPSNKKEFTGWHPLTLFLSGLPIFKSDSAFCFFPLSPYFFHLTLSGVYLTVRSEEL